VKARGFTHVSIHAPDLEESTRFYQELFGLERVPTPDFGNPVIWLRVGDLQLHLFRADGPAPERHHIGVDVGEDFQAVYLRVEELGIIDRTMTDGADVRELVSGELQLYVRDPGGNLVEINCRDSSLVDRSVVPLRSIEEERPQVGEARVARLYMT
jgi:catechol 2,3-dioxygenase-like lactoylglutathione lyase family enzyme